MVVLAGSCTGASSSTDDANAIDESSNPAAGESVTDDGDAGDGDAGGAELAGLTECSALWTNGDAPVDASASSPRSQIVAELKPMLGLPPEGTIVALGEGSNVYGRVTVTVPYRDPETLSAIRAIDDRWGEDDDICVDVPPVGYYDEPLPHAHWDLAPGSLLNTTEPGTITLLVGGECGGNLFGQLRTPQVRYSESQVVISLEIEHYPWGAAQTLACTPPVVVVVELSEPVGGRAIANCAGCQFGSDPNAAAPTPAPPTPAPPTPVPSLPAGQTAPSDTAQQLLQILQAAGFTDISGSYPSNSFWNVQAHWSGKRYVIFLRQEGGDLRESQAADQHRIDAGQERIECLVGVFFIDGDLPDDGRAALLDAANC